MNTPVPAALLQQALAEAVHQPWQLLQEYQTNASFFASPTQTLLAQSRPVALPQTGAALAQACAALLRAESSVENPALLLGAIPFAADIPASLGLAQQLKIADGPCFVPASNTKDEAPAMQLEDKAASAAYQRSIRQALQKIARAELEKVVLARALTLDVQVDIPALLHSLAARNLHGYRFAMPLAGGSHLVGASPELLLSRHGSQICSHPLAGSVPRSNDPHEDQRRAQQLLQSNKDLREHALVVDAVVATLRPYCRNLVPPRGPSLLATPTMWHLGTPIYGQLRELECSALEIALALHPTPAVCGLPIATAQAAIRELEDFERRYYAGLVGWSAANGDGEWAVSLRCAEISADSCTVYAGAGIVAGSQPELEWQEINGKLRTMLGALATATCSARWAA